MWLRFCAFVSLCVVPLSLSAGCGGNDVNDPDPRLIAGGGLGDGAIDGVINVYVIDGDSDEPISGAVVYVGEAGDELLQATTDSSGLARFEDGSLRGPITITAAANDYITQSWMGADGANVTIPLDLEVKPTSVDSAELSGTIAGWDQMTPDANHFYVAVAGYSQTDELGDRANEIQQPMAQPNALPPNACAAFASGSSCDFTVVSRTGTVALVASIIDIDTKGTQDSTDDTSTVVGYALRTGIHVDNGIDQTNLTLTQIDAADLDEIEPVLPSPPSGFDQRAALISVELGDSGIVPLGYLDVDQTSSVVVPALTGDLASASYRILAFAGDSTSDPADDQAPMSATITRGITDAGTVDTPEWLDQAANLALADGVYSFTPSTGATLQTGRLVDSQGNEVWGFALLDGRTTVALPEISPSPLPAGELDLVIDSYDGDLDLTDFAVDDLSDALQRLSKTRRRL